MVKPSNKKAINLLSLILQRKVRTIQSINQRGNSLTFLHNNNANAKSRLQDPANESNQREQLTVEFEGENCDSLNSTHEAEVVQPREKEMSDLNAHDVASDFQKSQLKLNQMQQDKFQTNDTHFSDLKFATSDRKNLSPYANINSILGNDNLISQEENLRLLVELPTKNNGNLANSSILNEIQDMNNEVNNSLSDSNNLDVRSNKVIDTGSSDFKSSDNQSTTSGGNLNYGKQVRNSEKLEEI